MGFSKGTLHYMKKNAEADKPFTLNAHVRERMELWEGIMLWFWERWSDDSVKRK